MSTLPLLRNNLDGTVTVMEDCARAHGPAIPAGTVSDGASVPWLLRRFWPRFGGWYDRAVLGHDWRYRVQNCSRRQADMELWCNMDADSDEALGECGSVISGLLFCLWAGLTACVFYYAVRVLGWAKWRRHNPCLRRASALLLAALLCSCASRQPGADTGRVAVRVESAAESVARAAQSAGAAQSDIRAARSLAERIESKNVVIRESLLEWLRQSKQP